MCQTINPHKFLEVLGDELKKLVNDVKPTA
jgi:hypothetical protein